MHIAILGAGMVGRTIAADLIQQYSVTSFDISDQSLAILRSRQPAVNTRQADLANYAAYPALLAPFDFVVSAVPGFMGYQTLEAIISAGKNVADISFFPEDALQLDSLAKEKNVTAIVDCGVAPGMSNLVLGYHNEQMTVTSFECYVGGLPKEKKEPWQYKAPFSPIDVIEEYTRPARMMEDGQIVTKPALSECELLEFDQVGTLEAFNTDGLRSLLFTMAHIPNMKEKTLRFPGHVHLVKALKASGFFDEHSIDIKGCLVRPLDVSAKLLIDQWKLKETDEEFTIMKIKVHGHKDGKPAAAEYDLYDVYDAATKTSSMSRTTGYTCTAALQLLVQQKFTDKGVFPPELVGKHETCFRSMLDYLAARGVVYHTR